MSASSPTVPLSRLRAYLMGRSGKASCASCIYYNSKTMCCHRSPPVVVHDTYEREGQVVTNTSFAHSQTTPDNVCGEYRP